MTEPRRTLHAPDTSLDPADWKKTRVQAHRMLDDILDFVENIRGRPVWQPIPDAVRRSFHKSLPHDPQPLEDIHAEFLHTILPYGGGNVHPGFMGWVQGGGTVPGLLAEMLAGGLNANLGGRDHIPIEVERQIVQWTREMFGFPESASGLFVTGTSMANLMAVLVARTSALGPAVRQAGLGKSGARLRGYASRAAHGCVRQAFDLSGFGTHALCEIAVDSRQRIKIADLRDQIRRDIETGLKPFVVIGSAGTVDVGAIDDLEELSGLCAENNIWFHIDGAYGALGVLSPDISPRLKGIEKADSIAFDFHKWGQVPYDAGFLLVRDSRQHMAAFASPAAYLRRETRGLSANSPWPCDFGPDLSRGFRALKTWFTLKAFGTARLGAMIDGTCAVARHLEARVRAEPELELLAEAQLNIVCFRYRGENSDPLNAAIVADLHESGIAAPSVTTIDGNAAIRAAVMNHRTRVEDVDGLVEATLAFGRRRAGI
ncbi:MAG TPA: pyridoxal-dependent decarboxylase [Rhizomicrobium sp.]|nr:pyridoxal-dependent decarboxylase [Rhizomicrobium sp.]